MIFLYKKIRQGFHIINKIFAFFCFGIGGLVFGMIVFPFINIFFHHGKRLNRIKRKIIRFAFGIFINLMRFLRLINIKVDNFEKLKNSHQMLICANHPSLIDVIILISLVPQADCVVKAKLWKNIFMKSIVGSIYIPNSLNVEDTIRECERSLREGNNLVIFPEGTRTVNNQNVKFRRSAAQISLRTGFSILPVQISTVFPSGLGKGDSILTAPDSGIIRYNLKIKSPINPQEYAAISTPKAARLLTYDLQKAIVDF